MTSPKPASPTRRPWPRRWPQWPRGLAATVVTGAAAPALLGLAWLVASALDSPLQADRSPQPQLLAAGSAARDLSAPVEVSAVHTEPFQVAGTGAGVVTAVHVSPGQTLAAGDPIVDVNDQPWVALVGDAPLWRDLRLGDHGADVDRLRHFLADLGYPAGSVSGQVTAATMDGVGKLSEALGRDGPHQVLFHELLLWVGAEPLTVNDVLIDVGDTVAAGQPLLSGPTPPPTISVRLPDGPPRPDAAHVLTVGSVEVPYDPGSKRVDDPASAVALIDAMRGDTQVGGVVRLAEPEPVGTVPVAAVLTDGSGQTCVFNSVTGSPIPVEVTGGSLSVAEVPADWIGKQILVNPREVRQDLSCG